jgi:DNA-directed RNA polymerase specialized sigma24 family protein
MDTALSPADSPDTKKAKWELTKEAFDKLLFLFSADQDEAAEKYEAMRRKLQRFFLWKLFQNADELVDEVINRVTRRIDEGETISNLNGYFGSVARNVEQEENRKLKLTSTLDDIPDPVAPDPEPGHDKESRLQCLEDCLNELKIESRTLILKYYYYDHRNKIDLRKQLANNLGIPLNALRIRAYRLRGVLEDCVKKCLETSSLPK